MLNELCHSYGILKYDYKDYRLVLEVDQDIVRYYRSLIPKWLETNIPRWHAHCTVVRAEKEKPVFLDYWGKYDNEEIKFFYIPIVRHGKIYFWLDVYCQKLEEIRIELGLPVISEYTLPPEGFRKCFHITVANIKGF